MNKFELSLALLLGLILGWWFYWPAEPPPTEIQPPFIQDKPSVAPLPPVPEKKNKALAPEQKEVPLAQVLPPAKQPVGPKQPPPGHLQFEVREGVAITQGDIVLGKVMDENKVDQGITKASRTRLWDSAEIPYSIQEGVTNRQAIDEAIQQFHKETNIRFVPYKGQKDSLIFVKADELCASYLGRVGGAQPIFLSPKCGAREVRHELMHALGFVHEHSRPDRDRYVEVVWTNIEQKYWPQFWVIPDDMIHDYVGSVFSFDSQSMMLYESTAFATQPGSVTLRSKLNQELQPTQDGFSRTDRERLFYLYGQ